MTLCPQLDLSLPLEEQGPLDVIIHKLTDLILEADQNDMQAVLLVQRVQVTHTVTHTHTITPTHIQAHILKHTYSHTHSHFMSHTHTQ